MQLVGRIGAALAGAAGLAILYGWYTTGGAMLSSMVPGVLLVAPTAAFALVLLSIALVA
ncbi:iron ABC transporter permease, partial [Cryobacterium sp. Sr8]